MTEGSGSQGAINLPAAGEDRAMIKPLTGLRAVAAFWVMSLHFRGIVNYPNGWLINRVEAYAAASVTMFFLLSGFVLTVNYQVWFAKGLAHWRTFARARVARMVPVYLLAFVMAGVVMMWARHYHPAQFGKIAETDTSLHNVAWSGPLQLFGVAAWVPSLVVTNLWNPTAWSVSTEFGFYALFPFITYFIATRMRAKKTMIQTAVFLMALEFVVFTGLLALAHYETGPAGQTHMRLALYEMPIFRLPEFLVGCLAGAIYLQLREEGSFLTKNEGAWYRHAMLAVGIGWCFFMMYTPSFISHPPGSLKGTLLLELGHDVLFLPGLSLVVFSLALGRTILHPILDHPVMQRLGLASYSIYLMHFTILLPVGIHYLKAETIAGKTVLVGHYPPLWVPAVLLLAILALGLLVHRFIELPARRAILRRGRVRAAAAAATVTPAVNP